MAVAATKAGEVGELEIANPFRLRAPDLQITPVGEIRYVEDRISVIRTLRDDQLARLHHRRHIGEAMYRAGRHWQRLYAEAAIGRKRKRALILDAKLGSENMHGGRSNGWWSASRKG